jgi:type I restriction enzyme, S subunit
VTAVGRVRVGDVLSMERIPVQPDPLEEYVAIGVRSFGRGIFHYAPAAGDELGSLRFFAVNAGRLVVSNIKGWEGAIAVSSEEDAGCIASNRFLIYDAVDHASDISWARWFFLSDPGIELVRRASPGSADRNRTLAVKRFEDLVIPLPPIDQQRRVATRLDQTQVAAERIANLAGRSKAVAAALRASLTAPHTESPGWRRVPLGAVLKHDPDQTPVEASEAYRIAGVYSFGRGLFERGQIDGSETTYKTLHRLTAGQLVMSRLKAWKGAIALVDDDFDGWYLSPEFPTFTVDADSVDRDFLKAVVTSESFWRSLGGRSKGIGARRERVNADRLLEQVVDLPPMDVQRRVAGQLRCIERIESARRGFLARAEAVVPSTLNREFAGVE